MNFRILLAALFAFTPIAAHAATFDDGNDRHFVKELRAKGSASLTDEEKAILTAASKVGQAFLCNGKIGANAYLIRIDGRPAVVIAAHWLFRLQSGTTGNAHRSDGALNCDPTSLMN